eukprot:SAG31_NODE_3623_length_4058_cov_5.815863_5_plen_127_part_00
MTVLQDVKRLMCVVKIFNVMRCWHSGLADVDGVMHPSRKNRGVVGAKVLCHRRQAGQQHVGQIQVVRCRVLTILTIPRGIYKMSLKILKFSTSRSFERVLVKGKGVGCSLPEGTKFSFLLCRPNII